MPHFPRTPEALLGRNDSKNPASTCRGITSTGRACRRALASPKSSPTVRKWSNVSQSNGADAFGQASGDVSEAELYCWQHKDQAEQGLKRQDATNSVNGQGKRPPTTLPSLREQRSIDTMVQKLGLDAASEERGGEKQRSRNPRPSKHTETNDYAAQTPKSSAPYAEKYNLGQAARKKSKPKKQGFWASLCCMTNDDDDYVEIVRHRKRIAQPHSPEISSAIAGTTHSTPNARFPTAANAVSNDVKNSRAQSQHQDQTLSNRHTNNLLSLIPQSLPPQTTSALFAELVKPISPYDEDGYIYIFWLTPSSHTPPTESTAKSLLTTEARPQTGRRISDVMTEYSFDGTDDHPPGHSGSTDKSKTKTVMLKIGRANNITRRMNEWQRQCGYALNLVRWYPYISTSASAPNTPSSSPQYRSSQPLYPDLSKPPPSRRESETVHKCPHIHRVERLIQIELASQQVKRQCGACGKEHREWFEVPATQAGVKAVDAVVRRWVGWAEGERDGKEF